MIRDCLYFLIKLSLVSKILTEFLLVKLEDKYNHGINHTFQFSNKNQQIRKQIDGAYRRQNILKEKPTVYKPEGGIKGGCITI